MTMDRPTLIAIGVGAAFVALLVGGPFFAVTTFIGDDHLFLAFARYVPNPLVAFVRDMHGGEFYRPIPMVVWWVLGRATAPGTWAFAGLALGLHAMVAVEVGVLVALLRRRWVVGGLAGLLFFVMPMTREAAYWYAASTDLFATAFGLGAVIALLRGRRWLAVGLFAAACWSKETAVVFVGVGALVLSVRGDGARAIGKAVAPWVGVAVVYGIMRTVVLRGVGGSGDVKAPFVGKLLQVVSGLVHAITGTQVLGEGIAWAVGVVGWVLLAVVAIRASQATGERWVVALAPVVVVVFAVVPLLAAPWIVGARYFYLASAGIAWLAADALWRRSPQVIVGVLSCLSGLGVAQDLARHAEVRIYETKVAAARRAVVTGLAEGFDTFHITADIKDLDLAVKEDPRVRTHEASLLVLGDVPASFVAVPAERLPSLDFLLAHPSLPPMGAYRFGDRVVVGLARRGEDPSLDDVLERFPQLRSVRLRAAPEGRVVVRDVTGAKTENEDVE